MSVATPNTGVERWTKSDPCPICDGHQGDPRGRGKRCHGFRSTDGAYIHCTREEHAGRLGPHKGGDTYAHKVAGPCRCGVSHSPAPARAASITIEAQNKRAWTNHGKANAPPFASLDAVVRHYEKKGATEGGKNYGYTEHYVYEDEHGEPGLLVTRFATEDGDKTFRQAAPRNGGWALSTKGVPPVLYRLPGVIGAVAVGDTIYIVEGEKDVHAIESLDCVATCNPGGAGKWRSEFSQYFEGADVVVVADKDGVGRKHAAQVAENLRPVVDKLTVVEAVVGKDASDALAANPDIREAFRATEAESLQVGPSGRFKFLRFDEIEPQLGSRGLIKGLINRESLVVTYGQSNSSKTFLALDMALCVATGRSWHGRRVTRGLVVYVACEGAGSLQNRVSAYRQVFLPGVDSAPFYLLPTTISLIRGDDIAPLIAGIRGLQNECQLACLLVVIDTLSQAMAGGNENGPEDMTTVVGAVTRIKLEIGCAVNLVHHTGKDESRGARGHSSLRAASDTEIEVSAVGTERYFEAKVTKQRDMEVGHVHHYELDVVNLGQDEDGDAVTTCVVQPVAPESAPKKKERGKMTPRLRIVEECVKTLIAQKECEPVPGLVREGHRAGAIQAGQFAVSRRAVLNLFISRVKEDRDIEDSSRDNIRRIFNRVIETGQAREIIGAGEGLLWLS